MEPHKLQKASYTQRFFAQLIDYIISFLYIFTIYYHFKFHNETVTQILFYSLIIITVISIYLYPKGLTIGKVIIRIKIVDAKTSMKPTIDALFIRSIIKGYSLFNSFLYGNRRPAHEEKSETKVVRLKNRRGIQIKSSDDDEWRLNI